MQASVPIVLLWSLLQYLMVPCLMGCEDPGSSATQHDAQLAGRWRRPASTGRRNQKTDIYFTLSPDGTFEYGGAVGDNVNPYFRQFLGPDNVVRGMWKTTGGFLYSKPDGSQQWTVLGRYSISDAGMVVHGGGKPRHWQR